MEGKLTIFFEDPFWVGVFEREDETGYRVSRIVFGSEPTDAELYEYIQREYKNLDFGRPIKNQVKIIRKKNFKRMQRDVRKEVYKEGKTSRALTGTTPHVSLFFLCNVRGTTPHVSSSLFVRRAGYNWARRGNHT